MVWLTLTPPSGHEQTGRRPVVVVSPEEYNSKVGLFLICPITSQAKGYPFEVPLRDCSPVSGVVLSDQVKSLDWRSRQAEYLCALPDPIIREIIAKLQALLQFD